MYKYNIKSKWIGKTIKTKMVATKKESTDNMITIKMAAANTKTKKE